LSASVAYAVSLPAFLSFTLPCLLPAIAYLFWGGDEQARLGLVRPDFAGRPEWWPGRSIG
jgi:hypothetical protein